MPNEKTNLAVTDADLAWRIVGHYMPNFMSIPASKLYHYTTGNSLISIVSGQSLWATQVACLNDTKELIYVAERLQKHVREKLGSAGETEHRALWEVIDRLLSEARTDTDGTFVACFSTRDDDLSQWRSYSGGTSGYAVHFAPDALAKNFSKDNQIYLARVEYDETKADSLIIDALKWMRGEFDAPRNGLRTGKDVETFAIKWLTALAFLAPCFKHPNSKTRPNGV